MAVEGQDRQHGGLRERFYQSVAETLTLLHPAADYDRGRALLDVATTVASTMDLPLVWIGRRELGQSTLEVIAAGPAAEYASAWPVSDYPREPGGRGPAGTALRDGRPQLASIDSPGDADWQGSAHAYGLDSVIVAAAGTADGGQLALAAYSRRGGPVLTDELLDWAQRLADELARFWDDQAQLERNLRLGRFRDAHRTIQHALLAHPEPAAIYMTLANALVKDAAASAVMVYVPEGDVLRREVGAGPLVERLAALPEPPRQADEPPLPVATQAWMEGEPVVRLRPSAWPDVSPAWHGESLGEVAAIGCWPIFQTLPSDSGEHHAAAVLLLAAADVDAFDTDLWRLLDEISDTVGLALRQYAQRQGLIREQERQTYLALHDALTDLPNRRALDYHLDRALARAARHHHLVAVGMLDLDDLKPINDRHGHAAGDHVLVEVAHRLHEALRSEDSVARVGGDEFVLVLEDLASEDDLAMLLERLWQSLQRPIALGDQHIDITVSLGVALYPTHAQDNGEQLLRLADQAMYHVKTHKQQRANWWALARSEGDAVATVGEEAGVAEAHGPQAAAALRACAESWQAQLPVVAQRFHAAIGAHAGIAGLLASFPASAREAFEERLARHLQTLCYPELDEAGQRAGAIRAGICQAACGLEEAWLAEAVEQLRTILAGSLGRGPRAQRDALAIVLQRLALDQQWQLESMRDLQRRRDATLAKIHAAAWSAHDGLDLLEDTVQLLAAHEELVVCAVGRPDAAGDMVSELVAGAVPAEYLRITNHGMAPSLQVDRVSAQAEEPLHRAWQSGEVERSAHYGSDPVMVLWRDTARRHGIVSQVAVPLCLAPGRPVALLALYSGYAGGFRSERQRAFIAQLRQVLELALRRMAPQRQLATLLPAFVRQRWRRLLAGGALRMHYQPMVRLADNQIAGFEALARLRDDAGSLQLPASFMPALGAAGLMRLFRDGIIQAVARQQSLARHGRALGMSVNVPVAALRDARYARTVETILQASGCPPDALRFEAFENASGIGCWALLAETGVQSLKSIEHHAPGNDRALSRNLVARLSQSPFDRIKVDHAVISQVRTDPLGTLRALRQLIRVSHDLGLEVVVEGLESAGMLEAAAILGADFGQGFALARPMPAEALPDWLGSTRPRRPGASPRHALGALASALRWEERFATLFDVPDALRRHIHAGGGAGDWLRVAEGIGAALKQAWREMLDGAAAGPFDPGHGRRRDRLFALLVEHALAEEQAPAR